MNKFLSCLFVFLATSLAFATDYPSVDIGDQIWMKKNLDIPIKGSKCYDDKKKNCETYGRLYNWEQAQKVCPDGWQLPSEKDLKTLIDYVTNQYGDFSNAILDLRWGGTNVTGMSMLLTGTGSDLPGYFHYIGEGEITALWATTEHSDKSARNLAIIPAENMAGIGKSYKQEFLSVRCMKDKPKEKSTIPPKTFRASDGEKYTVVKIGDDYWMNKNLNKESKKSVCYENKPKNCEKYGRLYPIDEALKICPKGWHLPTKDDIKKLLKAVGNKENMQSAALRDESWESGDNLFGFSALGGGVAKIENDTLDFQEIGERFHLWSSTEDKDKYNILYIKPISAFLNNHNDSYYASVRCIYDGDPDDGDQAISLNIKDLFSRKKKDTEPPVIEKRIAKATEFSASSTTAGKGGGDFDANNMISNDVNSAWAAPFKNKPITISMAIDSKEITPNAKIIGIYIENGYRKNEKSMKENGRAKTIDILVNGDVVETIELDNTTTLPNDDEQEPGQKIEFKESYNPTDSISIVIKSVYPGKKKENVVISHIAFFVEDEKKSGSSIDGGIHLSAGLDFGLGFSNNNSKDNAEHFAISAKFYYGLTPNLYLESGLGFGMLFQEHDFGIRILLSKEDLGDGQYLGTFLEKISVYYTKVDIPIELRFYPDLGLEQRLWIEGGFMGHLISAMDVVEKNYTQSYEFNKSWNFTASIIVGAGITIQTFKNIDVGITFAYDLIGSKALVNEDLSLMSFGLTAGIWLF